MATQNLTSTQITKWKTSVDSAITKKLVVSLKKINEASTQLKEITSTGQDENDLSYRFKDLAYLAEKSASKLNTFMNSFNTDLDSYIKNVKTAEATAAENIRKSIDSFRETANKIDKLSMDTAKS